VAQILPYLRFLACPIGMGAMMWMMMRSNQPQPATPPAADPRIAELESQVNDLRSAVRARGAQEPEGLRTRV
jgi:hypothetical protein